MSCWHHTPVSIEIANTHMDQLKANGLTYFRQTMACFRINPAYDRTSYHDDGRLSWLEYSAHFF